MELYTMHFFLFLDRLVHAPKSSTLSSLQRGSNVIRNAGKRETSFGREKLTESAREVCNRQRRLLSWLLLSAIFQSRALITLPGDPKRSRYDSVARLSKPCKLFYPSIVALKVTYILIPRARKVLSFNIFFVTFCCEKNRLTLEYFSKMF